MGLDLLAKISAIEQVAVTDSRELFEPYMALGEEIVLSYKHVRDKIVFTTKKIIIYDVQGLSGVKKEFRFFPYSKITSFSVETAGTFDMDSDFKIWVSGVGIFSIKFGKKIDINEIGAFLIDKVQ